MKQKEIVFILFFITFFFSLSGQKKNSSIIGLYNNSPNNPFPGTDDEKRLAKWSLELFADSTFKYHYLYDKQVYDKIANGKWTLKDSLLTLIIESKDGKLLKWGKHKTEYYLDDQLQELIRPYDEYFVRNSYLISVPDGKIETRSNVVLFVKRKK